MLRMTSGYTTACVTSNGAISSEKCKGNRIIHLTRRLPLISSSSQ